MTSLQHADLTDDELEQLSALINSRYDDGMGPPLEMVDGLLSAVVVSPTLIPPSDYIPLVFGADGAWETMEQAQQAMELLMRLQNQVARRIALPLSEEDGASEEHMPLLLLPEGELDGDQPTDEMLEADPFAGIDPDFPFAALWAHGFLLGVDLRDDAFRVLESELDWLTGDLDMLATLSEAATEDDEVEPDPSADQRTPLALRERFEHAMQIPFMLSALNDHRLAHGGSRVPVRAEKKPGRNDLCSCGSGRKYKRCCGAN